MSDDDISERIGAAIHSTAARVEAPRSLHAHVSPGRQREAPARRRRGVVALAAAAATTLAAFAVLGVLLLTGDAADPTVADAAPLALRPATAAPPAVDPSDKHFIRAQVGGVRFPNYAYDTPWWKTLGARTDKVDGRSTMTVLYSSRSGPVGYTIVDGKPLAIPDGARKVTVGGETFWTLRRDGAAVVTWREGGRTCIVSGRGATSRQLLDFASWGED
jgi:hypothetical protein